MVNLLLALLVLPGLAWAQSKSRFPQNDQQIWGDFQVSHKINQRTSVEVGSGLRGGSDAGHLIYQSLGAGLSFKPWKFLSLSPKYSFFRRDSSPSRESTENRISLAATARLPLGHWTIADRNLFERRFLSRQTTFRYRNRVQLERAIAVRKTSIKAFVSDEVFYDTQFHAWVRNRIAIGGGKKLSRNFSLDLYYLRQNDGFARPGDLNVLGMTVDATF